MSAIVDLRDKLKVSTPDGRIVELRRGDMVLRVNAIELVRFVTKVIRDYEPPKEVA